MVKKEKKQELIFGVHPLIELLKAKRRSLHMLYTTDPAPRILSTIAHLIPRAVQIQYVSRDVLTRMAQSSDHQGIVAWAAPFPVRTKPFEPAKHPFLLMADGIQDPRNLGALIRSAYCVGVTGIVLAKKEGVSLTATAIKASAGLVEHMDVYQAPSAAAAAQELTKAGYTLYVAMMQGQNAVTVSYKRPLCLVIGSEGKGVSSSVAAQGIPITLPQQREDIAYNASVAGGILLFLIAQQLQSIKI